MLDRINRVTASESFSRENPLGQSLPAILQTAVLLVTLALGAGCGNLAGPDYERPDTPEKATWSDDNIATVSASQTIRPDWWRNFNDPYLDELIAQAITGNIDLKILAARIGVAQATVGQANAARLPTIDASLGGRAQTSSAGGVNKSVSYAGAIGWEADIWGKFKKGVQAQEAELKASEADWRAGYLSLASDVATTYFTVRKFDEQIHRQQQALERNQKITVIYSSLLDEGIVPKTQVLKQQAEVNGLKNDLLELQRIRALGVNALSTLLGTAAGDMQVPAGYLSESVDIVAVPGGLPAELLTRRPDIIASEYRVLQSHELLGQARLAKLPGIGLTAGGGGTSNALNSLLKSWTLGLSPTISIPIFDPSINARLKVADASTKVAEQEYRRTVINAFGEVENALTNLASRREQRKEITAQRDKLRVISKQTRAQMAEGMVSQLEVLESERSVLAAELALLANQQLILTDTVTLYKALGGGWPDEPVRSADQARAQQ